MNWKNFLGESLYEKMVKYTKERKITIACFIRLAVENFVKDEA
jgi:hypothetical protein